MGLVVLLAACATQQAPPPAPPDPRFGAPTVAAPRDVRSFGNDPCTGPLTAPDWDTMGISSIGVAETAPTGDRWCVRRGSTGDRSVSLTVVAARDVLVDTYRVRQFPLFREVVIGGLPAAVEQSSPDSVSCSVTVGTAQDQGFIVDYSEYEFRPDGRPDDPCGRAQRVAERVVAALPPLPAK
ncbi:DUF3558 domain-containing protein [Actinomycetospora lemnae]|uniref:DUF3558 domain-containing protein n=1 Tax=Actinomycetospora lemnae TaxID=3019891 RepID=A0ABT5T3Q4_9PSEU|nr:DUF3558 domain-containing protein [Actinomycetospora sp. DW7H6]MDD7968568.1 DUF3558 domain-containing protein [Actinomycetospora sp. DW7H6]